MVNGLGSLWRDLFNDNKLGLSQPWLCFDLNGGENINAPQDNLRRLLKFPPFHVSWVTEFQRPSDVQSEWRVTRSLSCLLLEDNLGWGGNLTHGNLLWDKKRRHFFTNPKDRSNIQYTSHQVGGLASPSGDNSSPQRRHDLPSGFKLQSPYDCYEETLRSFLTMLRYEETSSSSLHTLRHLSLPLTHLVVSVSWRKAVWGFSEKVLSLSSDLSKMWSILVNPLSKLQATQSKHMLLLCLRGTV